MKKDGKYDTLVIAPTYYNGFPDLEERIHMYRSQLLKKIKNGFHNWISLGLAEDYQFRYDTISEYNDSLARDNLNVLHGYCLSSFPLLLIFMFGNWALKGITLQTTLPIFIAALAFLLLLHLLLLPEKGELVSRSYMYTAGFNAIWYAVAIYFDVIINPERPAVYCCIAFALLALLYTCHPRDNIAASLIVYVIALVLDYFHASTDIFLANVILVFFSAMLGLILNQRNTKASLNQKLYLDMYKSATKISILVMQIDLTLDSYRVLQCPDYMEERLSKPQHSSYAAGIIEEQFVSAEFRGEFRSFINLDTLSDRLLQQEQLSFYFKDFRDRWCQLLFLEQKRTEDRITSVIAIVRDVDEERQKELSYQRRLREVAREAELANSAKTNFLSRMTHDIRTPLNGIIGLLNINKAHRDDTELVWRNQEKMLISANYLLSLVNDILEMSKLEAGEVLLSREVIDLKQIAMDIVTIVEPRAANAGISIRYEQSQTDLIYPYIYSSPLHLRQIFLNIMSNCIKYNKPNGMVTTRFYCLGAANGLVTYRCVISDTGIGMSKEFIQHIFEPFSQEHTDARSVYQGTGLGMSIVKNLLDKMNGSIEIVSDPGLGSTFTITIPFEIAPAEEFSGSADSQSAGIRGLHFLLAEDNELNAEIAQTLLADEGAATTLASNGKEALELFKSNPPGTFDAILMDMMMPVMDGLFATRSIRALDRPDAAEIPIIAMTANAFSEDAKRCIDAGMNAHLSKPLQMDLVVSTIARFVHPANRQ